MTRAARVYDFTIPAGGAITVLAEGSFYRLMTAAGGIEVRRNNGSIVGPLLPGQGERAEFLSLTLTDKSGASNPGSILIGDDTFIDDRISGEVSVINGAVSRALAGVAYVCGDYSNPVAGQYSHVSLFNPGGSGRLLVVSKITMSSYVTLSGVRVRRSSAALANAALVAPVNKLESGPASVAAMSNEASAASLGGAQVAMGIWAAPNSLAQIDFAEPILIGPGSGIVLGQLTVNQFIWGNFEYWERPI